MVAVLDHPPYYPDLALADFMFPRLKAAIKCARFVDMNAITDRVTASHSATDTTGGFC